MIKWLLKKIFGKIIIINGYEVDGIKPNIYWFQFRLAKTVAKTIDRDLFNLFAGKGGEEDEKRKIK